MKRTVEEKYNYNKSKVKENDFSFGYCLGVEMYCDYPKSSAKGRKKTLELIDNFGELARSGDMISKGFMCGIRDSANERKARKNRK